jgi:SAM-dependent methyltransferase
VAAATYNASYVGPRPELVDRVPPTCVEVLDLGCATGEVGLAIKRRNPAARVTGIEIDPAMAAVAATHLDRVVRLDLDRADEILVELGGSVFDAIVAGDVLEHLVDPWRCLRVLAGLTAPGAVVSASIPNIGYWATWRDVVLRRHWPYRPRGVHDATHLRFFARANLAALFEQAGFEDVRIDPVYRLNDLGNHRWERHAPRLAIPGVRDLLTYQFLVTARRRAGVEVDPDRPVIRMGELGPPPRAATTAGAPARTDAPPTSQTADRERGMR